MSGPKNRNADKNNKTKNITLNLFFPLNIPTNPKRNGMNAIYIFISERFIPPNDGIVKSNKPRIFPVYNSAARGRKPNERKSPHWPKPVREFLKILISEINIPVSSIP